SVTGIVVSTLASQQTQPPLQITLLQWWSMCHPGGKSRQEINQPWLARTSSLTVKRKDPHLPEFGGRNHQ
ncbi:hypothetical protein V5799_032710, partial [Amblyomma americanum]